MTSKLITLFTLIFFAQNVNLCQLCREKNLSALRQDYYRFDLTSRKKYLCADDKVANDSLNFYETFMVN